MNQYTPYSTKEDALILRSRTANAAHKRLRGRTLGAVKRRFHQLRHPEELGSGPCVPGIRLWTEEEKAVLCRMWPTARHIDDVSRELPRFNRSQIRGKAHQLGVKRIYLGIENVKIAGHRELVDQIRTRAKQDGMALRTLDGLTESGWYFRTDWKRNRINLRAVVKALELFGATLVIDWCDR